MAILVLAALAAVLLLWQRPWQGSDDPVVAFPTDAPVVLAEQFRTLSAAQSAADFVTAAGDTDAARTFAANAWAARQALGASQVELRYVSGGEVADHGDGSAEVKVEVSWRPGDESGLQDTSKHAATVAVRVLPRRDGTFAIQGAHGIDDALPLWLAGKVEVTHRPGIVVVRVDGGAPEISAESMTTTARAAVRRVVPGTEGEVAVVLPHSQAEMAELVGQDASDLTQIAAVTTRLDGRSDSAAATVIMLNPVVFATMDLRAAQVVVTHEATHLLTGAIGSDAETWVVEGFADFVALHDDRALLAVSAGQILAEVRDGRTPEQLPSATDFDASRHGLGAVYESAWMVFRMLAERHGDADVIAFYRSVLDGTDLDAALQSSFGLTTPELTTQWRAYLTKSASTVS